MIYALKYLRGDIEEFDTEKYDMDTIDPYRDEILGILCKRQVDACADWKAFGEKLSGQEIPEFSVDAFRSEYESAPDGKKDDTGLGRFVLAALAHKSMVTNRIYKSGSMLAGYSLDYDGKDVGIKDYLKLLRFRKRGNRT
jgi:hypothetical protein